MIYTFAMIILRDLSRTKSCDLDVTPSVVYKHRPTLLNFAETFAYQFLLAIVVYVVVPFYPWFKFHFSFFWSMVMSIMSLKAAVRVFINDLLNHLSFSRNNFWKWYRLRKSYSLSYNSFLTHSVLQHLNWKWNRSLLRGVPLITSVTLITFGTNSLLYLGPFK